MLYYCVVGSVNNTIFCIFLMQQHFHGESYMNQSTAYVDDANAAFRKWGFQEVVEIEHRKQEILEENKKLKEKVKIFEEEKRQFEKEKREFLLKKQLDDRKLEHEEQLFRMKWKILEDELKKLSAEKEQVERQRDFYRYVSEHESYSSQMSSNVVKGEMFFCGVESEKELKKRYKDLIKIYHPDNISGDTTTIQEINSEYEKLLALYQG